MLCVTDYSLGHIQPFYLNGQATEPRYQPGQAHTQLLSLPHLVLLLRIESSQLSFPLKITYTNGKYSKYGEGLN